MQENTSLTDLKKFAELWTEMDPALLAYREEAKALRASVSDPGESDSLQTHHDRLIAQRRAQTRLGAILADVRLIRSRVKKLVFDLQAIYDDKFAENVVNDRTGEYMSGKAQDAKYSAGALQEMINLRRAKRMLADVEEVFEYVKDKYYDLGNARSDTDSIIRILTLENSLSRS